MVMMRWFLVGTKVWENGLLSWRDTMADNGMTAPCMHVPGWSWGLVP